jgi:hypothetical protein
MIKDQRVMEARNPRAKVPEVKAAWAEISESMKRQHGGEFPNSGRTEPVQGGNTARAYVSDNRWVADCPEDGCNAGIAAWPGNSTGFCFECGTETSLEFPPDMAAGVAVLELRPPENRHWLLIDGEWEAVDDLKAQNLLNGYTPVQP